MTRIHQKTNNDFVIELLKVLLLALITAVVYSNTLHNQFVFDDSRIYLNPHIRLSSLSLDGLTNAWQQSEPRTRPLANTSFAINYFFHQYQVEGYHLVNIAIHIITGIFLFLLLKTTLSLPALAGRYQWGWLPFLSALIWLVHPVQTQSVTYTVQRMNSMAAMFYVIALFSYVRGRLSAHLWWKVLLFCTALVGWLLALWSKEIAVTLPLFIFLYDWYFIQDLECGWLKKYGLLVGGIVCLLVLATLLFYFGNDPFHSLLAGYGGRDFTLGERLLTESRVVIFYLSLLGLPLPSRLNLGHDFTISQSLFAPTNTIFSLVALILLFGLALSLARRQRLLSFGILWFFGHLVIESTFVPLEIIFDHRLYLPSMILIPAVLICCREYLPDNSGRIVMVVALVLVFSCWTYQRNRAWADPVALWSDCTQKSPDKARNHSNLGVALKQVGRLAEAENHFLTTVRLDPTFFEAYNNLGNIRVAQGRLAEAVAFYAKGLEIKPNSVLLHINMGHTLSNLWRLDEALEHYKKALVLAPGNTEAKNGFYRVSRAAVRHEEGGVRDKIQGSRGKDF